MMMMSGISMWPSTSVGAHLSQTCMRSPISSRSSAKSLVRRFGSASTAARYRRYPAGLPIASWNAVADMREPPAGIRAGRADREACGRRRSRTAAAADDDDVGHLHVALDVLRGALVPDLHEEPDLVAVEREVARQALRICLDGRAV